MIYFVQATNGGPIKIGTTIRLSERLQALAREAGEDLKVVAVTQGSFPEESSLHRRFAHLRVVNEWFEPGDDLLGFIVESCQPWDGTDETEPTKTVRIALSVYEGVVQVAGMRKMELGAYLSEALRPVIERDRKAEARKILGND